MLERFSYTNHMGETIEFGKNGLYANESDLRDFAWEITSRNNRISGFKKGIVSKTLPVTLGCSSESEGITLRNRLFEVFEKDVLAKKHGKIQIGDYYLKCFVTGSKKSRYLYHKNTMVVSLTVQTDSPEWIKETTIDYVGTPQETPTEGLAYTLSEDGSYYKCVGIGTATDTNIVIPDYVDGLRVLSIDESAFQGCTTITSLTTSDRLQTIGYKAFEGCPNLTSVKMGNNVNILAANAFYNCPNLTSVTTSKKLRNVGQNAFRTCPKLLVIHIPKSVTSMGYSVFEDCSSLTIYCEAESMPSTWSAESSWNYSQRPVIWGHDGSNLNGNYLDYAYNFPFDYKNDATVNRLVNTNFVSSNFILTIFGGVENPTVIIGGHRYTVNVTVAQDEYLTIDSKSKTIIKTTNDGKQVNCFNDRDRNSYVFEKIPVGTSEIVTVGDLTISLVLLDERSEPKWT